jgi:hypothetical protein
MVQRVRLIDLQEASHGSAGTFKRERIMCTAFGRLRLLFEGQGSYAFSHARYDFLFVPHMYYTIPFAPLSLMATTASHQKYLPLPNLCQNSTLSKHQFPPNTVRASETSNAK